MIFLENLLQINKNQLLLTVELIYSINELDKINL